MLVIARALTRRPRLMPPQSLLRDELRAAVRLYAIRFGALATPCCKLPI